MKVAYDISQLGLGYHSAGNRTGIFRAVEHVASALAASPEVTLAFTAAERLGLAGYTRDYLETAPGLKAVPFLHSGDGGINVVHALLGLVDTLGKDPRRGPLKRSVRRLAYLASSRIERLAAPLAAGDLQGFDIFHSPFFALPGYTAGIKGLTRVLTVYDLIPILYPQYVSRSQDSILYGILRSVAPRDFVLAISQSVKDDFCSYKGMDPAHVFVTYLAADPSLFYPCRDGDLTASVRSKYHIPEGRYILSVNTLEPRKNMEHAIRSFARLIREQHIDDLYFVLVGALGWQHNATLDMITADPLLRGKVITTGYVEDADLAPLYNGALAFIFPSLAEGFGLPPLEAMQCGVPVITSNTTSLPEVVGDAGIMVGPNDADALCQAMLDVYRHPQLRAALSAKSLARAALFSWERCVQETIAVYNIVAAQ